MSDLLNPHKPGKVIEEYLKTSPIYDEAESEVKPARQRISSPDQSEPPFQYNIRLEILAEQIRAGKSVSMKDTLEVDYYMEQKQKALVKARTSGELALEITAWICAIGILGLVLWGLVT